MATPSAAITEWDASGNPIQAGAPAAQRPMEWDADGNPLASSAALHAKAGFQTSQGAPAPAPPGFFQSAEASFLQPIEHPIQTVEGMIAPIRAALPSYGGGGPMGQIPIPNMNGADLGQAAILQGKQALQNPMGTAGTIAGQLPYMAAGDWLEHGMPVPGAVADAAARLKPTSLPTAWSQAAAQDRPWLDLASRIGPTGSSQKTLGVVPSLADDLKQIVPQLGGKTGARTPLEFSKAVDHFRKNIAGPAYSNVRDPFAGEKIGIDAIGGKPAADYVLKKDGQPLGPNPTIGRAEEALRELNEITGPFYQKAANAFDKETVMKYNAMADKLRRGLNARIGELSGMSPESIGALRQRIGQAGNIAANAQERAIANRLGITSGASAAANAETARTMPARFVRGAVTEPIKNFEFRRALRGAENAAFPAAVGPSRLDMLINYLRQHPKATGLTVAGVPASSALSSRGQ